MLYLILCSAIIVTICWAAPLQAKLHAIEEEKRLSVEGLDLDRQTLVDWQNRFNQKHCQRRFDGMVEYAWYLKNEPQMKVCNDTLTFSDGTTLVKYKLSATPIPAPGQSYRG